MSTQRIIQEPILVDENEKVIRVQTKHMPSEKWLQKILPTHPELLPTAAIDKKYANLLCIGTELSVDTSKKGKGHIDILYISDHGHLVLVETKLYRNQEACREVVGQILDYAASMRSDWDYDTLANVYKGDLYSDIKKKLGIAMDEDEFIQTVNDNIRNADFMMMIVGDEIRPSVEKIASFINSPMDMHHILVLCEMSTYSIGNHTLVVPRLTTSTKLLERAVIRIKDDRVELISNKPTTKKESGYKYFELSDEEFIAGFTSKNKTISAGTMHEFFDDLRQAGCEITKGTKQAAIGIPGLAAVIHMGDRIWITPSEVIKKAKTAKRKQAVEKFMERLIPMLAKGQTPYNSLNKFYIIASDVITTKREKLIAAFRELQNNL